MQRGKSRSAGGDADANLASARCPACWARIDHLPGAPMLWGDVCTAALTCAACAASIPYGARVLQGNAEWLGARRRVGLVVEPGAVRIFHGLGDQPRVIARREIHDLTIFGSPGPWSTILRIHAARMALPAQERGPFGVRLPRRDLFEVGVVLGDGGWGTPERLQEALRATLDSLPNDPCPEVPEAACRCPKCGYPMRGCTAPLSQWWVPLAAEIYCTECGLRAPEGAILVPQTSWPTAGFGSFQRRGLPYVFIPLIGLGGATLLFFGLLWWVKILVLPLVAIGVLDMLIWLARRASSKAGGPPPNGAWIVQPGSLRIVRPGGRAERVIGAGRVHSFELGAPRGKRAPGHLLSVRSPRGGSVRGARPLSVQVSDDLNERAVTNLLRTVLLQPEPNAGLSSDE